MTNPSTVEILSALRADCAETGVPYPLAKAICITESSMRQVGADGTTLKSPAGCLGLMQLAPATAAQYGADPHDWRQNLRGGVLFLSYLLSRFGYDSAVPDEVIASYNHGPGAVSRKMIRYGSSWRDRLPAETKSYLSKVRSRMDAGTA